MQAFREFHQLAFRYQIQHMLTIDELRRKNLARLVDEFPSQKELADAIGCSESQLSQWVKGSADSKSGKPRGMRLATCHRIEDAAGKPRGWLDSVHAEPIEESQAPANTLPQIGGVAKSPPDHPVSHPFSYAGSPKRTARVPVIGTVKMQRGGEFREADVLGPAGEVEAHSVDERSYAIRISGDELHPYARHGQCLVMEPDGECVEGENVLVRLTDGRILVRELGAIRSGSITVRGVIDGKRETFENQEVTSMHPIASVVTASKWRPSP